MELTIEKNVREKIKIETPAFYKCDESTYAIITGNSPASARIIKAFICGKAASVSVYGLYSHGIRQIPNWEKSTKEEFEEIRSRAMGIIDALILDAIKNYE